MGSGADTHGKPRGRRLRRRLALLVFACAFALVGLEIAVRVFSHAVNKPRGMGFHPEFGWRPLPNIEKTGAEWCGSVPAVTNSRGWRDDEVPFATPAGERRLVALGDSFTFGQGVDFGQRFSEVLEGAFERLQVVNLGVPGYGTDQALRVFEVEGREYGAEVVLLTVFLGNDLKDIRHERHYSWPKPWYRLVDGDLQLQRPEPGFDVRLRMSSYLAEFLVQAIESPESRSRRAAPWKDADVVPLYRALLERLAEQVRANGGKLLITFAHPPWNEVPQWAQRAIETTKGLGIETLDTFEHLRAAVADGDPLFLDDGHWTARGHRLVGEAMTEKLRRLGWL